jgi:hypothetical protein
MEKAFLPIDHIKRMILKEDCSYSSALPRIFAIISDYISPPELSFHRGVKRLNCIWGEIQVNEEIQ